jgi:hypothetical protein
LIGDDADVEEAVKMFTWLEAFDWKVLPGAGGLEDQDEVLMSNIFAIADSVHRIHAAQQARKGPNA